VTRRLLVIDDDAVTRELLTEVLQGEGYSLEVIKRILDQSPGATAAEVLNFTRAVTEPFGDEVPELVDQHEMVERWGKQLTAKLAERIQKLGLVRAVGNGQYEVLSPRLQAVSEELVDLGIPLETSVDW